MEQHTDNPRKSPRALWADYNDGDYFVTICTHDRKHYFGAIQDGKMVLSEVGRFLQDNLEHPELHHPHIVIPHFVVMPNHMHAIVSVRSTGPVSDDVSTTGVMRGARQHQGALYHKARPLLPVYINHLKGAVSRYATSKGVTFKWQSRYHDHIIRGVRDGENIVAYIHSNVARWEADCFYNSIERL